MTAESIVVPDEIKMPRREAAVDVPPVSMQVLSRIEMPVDVASVLAKFPMQGPLAFLTMLPLILEFCAWPNTITGAVCAVPSAATLVMTLFWMLIDEELALVSCAPKSMKPPLPGSMLRRKLLPMTL